MDFGIFVEQVRRGVNPPEAFQEISELVTASESWGLDIVWFAEMMVNPTRSVLSAPLLVASWAVSRTKRLRVGTAVQLLPLNHPLRVAGEIATLDQLSQGRFDFGIGRSGSPRTYDALGVPYGESQARFFEALEIILTAWKGESFSYSGQFYQFKDVTVAPLPYRKPHPLVRMAATTAESFPRVGRMGLPIFVGLRGMDIPELTSCLKAYRESWREAGHPGDGDACLRIPLYAAPTEDAARDDHLLHAAPGRPHPRVPRPHRLGRRASRSSGTLVDAHLRRHSHAQGRLRYRAGADRPARSAQGGARPDGRRGRVESRRSPAVRSGDAQPPDPHSTGDARTQVATRSCANYRFVSGRSLKWWSQSRQRYRRLPRIFEMKRSSRSLRCTRSIALLWHVGQVGSG